MLERRRGILKIQPMIDRQIVLPRTERLNLEAGTVEDRIFRHARSLTVAPQRAGRAARMSTLKSAAVSSSRQRKFGTM